MIEDVLYKEIINSLEEGIYFVDAERRISLWNRAAEKITGYTRDEIIGRYCHDNILSHIDMSGKPLCMLGCPLLDTIGDGAARQEEVLLRHKDGHRIAVLIKALPLYEDGKIAGAVEIFTPVACLVGSNKLVDSLTDLVMTDSLTGLPNRMSLDNNLLLKAEEFKRFGQLYSVMMLDIDEFRCFNNVYGHQVGDKVLRSIASSLIDNTRDTDTIGRWGGEEFVGLFSINYAHEAYEIAEKIRMLVANSEIQHCENCINVTCSIGVAVAQPDDTLESILQRADEMMYISKQRGKNCVTADYLEQQDVSGLCGNSNRTYTK